MRKQFPSVLTCHRKAKEALRGRSGVRFSVASLSFLCFFAFCGICAACGTVMYTVELHTQALWYCAFALVALLLIGLLLAPLWEGCLSFFCRLVRYGRVGAAELLAFFVDKRRYRYALLRYFGRLLRNLAFGLAFLVIAGLGYSVAAYLTEMGSLARGALVAGGTLLFLVLLVILSVRASYRTYLMEVARFSVPTLSYRAVSSVSAIGMRYRYGRVLLLDLSFLPLFIVGFVFAGIPLFFIFPHYLAARTEMALALLSMERQ